MFKCDLQSRAANNRVNTVVSGFFKVKNIFAINWVCFFVLISMNKYRLLPYLYTCRIAERNF